MEVNFSSDALKKFVMKVKSARFLHTSRTSQ